MGKNITILVIIVILALGGWWYFANRQNDDAMMQENSNSMEEQMEGPNADNQQMDDSMQNNDNKDSMGDDSILNVHLSEAGMMEGGITLTDGNNELTHVMPDQIVDLSASANPVKEVTMTSYTSMIDGKPAPRFSTKEITVKKGDKVKINVTVTAGTHNFNIDEYNIHEDTPLNQPVTIEFTADKTGTFIYYCAMPMHRQLGHWGVLKVVE